MVCVRLGWTAGILLACVVGCSGSSNDFKLSGNVTVGGEPVAQGEIRFVPVDGKGATSGAAIQDGKYQTVVPRGKKIVQITGYKKTGEKKADPHLPESAMVPVLKPVGQLKEPYEVTQAGVKDFQLAPTQ
jgi:hypothetical protein